MDNIIQLFQLNYDFINNKDKLLNSFKLPIEYLDKLK